MAPGKHRTTKRSSGGSSYASTVTTVVFVCIFILGIWMLTSNSYVSPNKSLARLSQHSTSTSSQIRSRKIPIDSPAFEDNPGDLPEDAIQGDEGSATNVEPSNTTLEVEKHLRVENDEKYKEEVQLSEESAMTQNQHLEVVPLVEIPSGNNDNKRKKDHREKQNATQMNMTVGNDKWGMVNDDKNQHGKMTVGNDTWGIRKMTVGNGKRGMVNNDKNQQKKMTIGDDIWGMVNDDKNQQSKMAVGDDKWGIRKMTIGDDKWGMVNNEKNQRGKMTVGDEKWGIRKMTIGVDKWGMGNDDKNQQKKVTVGDDKWGIMNDDKTQQSKITVGDDKWGVVNDDKNQQRKITLGDEKWGVVNDDKNQQRKITLGDDKWGVVNDDKNQQRKMTVGDDKWGIRKMTVGDEKWGMVNEDKDHQRKIDDKWGVANDDKNQQRKMAVGDNRWGIRKMTVGDEKWGMVNDDKNQHREVTVGDDKWGVANDDKSQQRKMTVGDEKWGIRKMTVGDEKWGMVKDDKNQQRKITVGDDKWGMVKDDEHDVTEEEKERMINKHQQKQEESQDDEEMSKALIPKNEKKPPVEVAKTQSTTTSDNDSKVEVNRDTIPKESNESTKEWITQAGQSDNEKERQDRSDVAADHMWELCNVTSGADYVPCLDNEKEIMNLQSRKHFEHRERHCPKEAPMCLVPIPEGYKTPIPWPQSRDKIWFHNVPHRSLANVKGHQNWVKVTGEFLTFPGGGTQFINGALHYIDVLQQAVPEIEWGKHTRVVLDVGCGVASFGGYLFDRNVLAMSLAPKDEHEAQIQFALERGIPAISAVMGSQRLPFPSNAYDLIHCARCRVPWHREGGMLLLELNRLLRPGGYFVWSATPVYRKNGEDAQIWKDMSTLTVAMCWELVTIKKDDLNEVAVAIYRKPESNECYNGRKIQEPPMCKPDDDPNAAWYTPLHACMHNIPIGDIERGSRWPEEWPARVQTPPYWLSKSQMGIHGKPAPDDFKADYIHWKRVVSKSYMSDLGFNWTNVRNVMDMRAVYGGFAAALKDLKLWVLNVVNTDSPDTLPIIFERGLLGIYHDWCESFSTYPRTYDLLHADHLFSVLKKRCDIAPVIVEVDRIVRPGGKLIVCDEPSTLVEVKQLLKSLHWDVHLTASKNKERILSAQKSTWRPDTYASAS